MQGYFSKDPDVRRVFELSAAEEMEAIVVLSQPDWHLLNEKKYDESGNVTGKVNDCDYSVLHALVSNADGEELFEVCGEHDSRFGPSQKLFIGQGGTLTIGPEPLTIAIADQGGEGHKFTLRVYYAGGSSAASLHQLPGERDLVDEGELPDDDPLRLEFAKVDATGDGSIDQNELMKLLLELDLMPSLDEEAKVVYLEEQLQKADTNGDGKIDFGEFIEYYNACIAADLECTWSGSESEAEESEAEESEAGSEAE